jgi:hypothetical protein
MRETMDIGNAIRAAEQTLTAFLADRGFRVLSPLRGGGGHNDHAHRWVVTFDYDVDVGGLKSILDTLTELSEEAEVTRIASRIKELDFAQKKGTLIGGAPSVPPLAMVWVDDHDSNCLVVEFQGKWLGNTEK